MVRSVLAVVLGVVVTTIVITGVESISSLLYPLPAGFDLHDREALQAFIAGLPVGAFLLVVFGWFLGTFCGAALAARVGRRTPAVHAVIVGIVSMAAGILNLAMLRHPAWVWVAGLLAFVVATLAAILVSRALVKPAAT
jgi:hypothetical protein